MHDAHVESSSGQGLDLQPVHEQVVGCDGKGGANDSGGHGYDHDMVIH
jgi:hypothetical protein